MLFSRVFPSWLVLPGDVEEEKTLELHLLDFGRQVCAVTLEGRGGAQKGQGSCT